MTDETTSTTLLTASDASIPSGYPGLIDSAGTASVTDYVMANWAGGDSSPSLTLQQVASDDFNRANAQNLGTNWHVGPGHGPIQIVSDQIEPYPAGGQQPSKEHYVAAGAFPNDQWGRLQAVVQDTVGDLACELRASDTEDTMYVADLNVTGGPGTGETRIVKVLQGNIIPLVIDQQWSSVSPGDYIRGQVQGSLITLIDDTTGVLLLTTFDTDVTSGYPGVSIAGRYRNGGRSYCGQLVGRHIPLRTANKDAPDASVLRGREVNDPAGGCRSRRLRPVAGP